MPGLLPGAHQEQRPHDCAGIGQELEDEPPHTREATAFTERLAAGASLAVRDTKLALNKLVKDALNVAFDASTALALVTFQSEDHQEALAALREKRLPVFKDR
jgi:enoyl-CoA hydratase/carnithine racemase